MGNYLKHKITFINKIGFQITYKEKINNSIQKIALPITIGLASDNLKYIELGPNEKRTIHSSAYIDTLKNELEGLEIGYKFEKHQEELENIIKRFPSDKFEIVRYDIVGNTVYKARPRFYNIFFAFVIIFMGWIGLLKIFQESVKMLRNGVIK